MASLSSQLRNFIVFLLAIGLTVYAINLTVESIISDESFFGLQITVRQMIQCSSVIIAGLVVALLARRFAGNLKRRVGPYPASVFSYTAVVIDFLVTLLTILSILKVPADSLLLGGGFSAIVIGMAVSTVFGNVFSGALMLVARPVSVGDEVLVNGIPGRIEEITTLFTKVYNDSGTLTIIPNTAVVSGSVILTMAPSSSAATSRLPFKAGDRVYTTYVGGEGYVKLVEALYTTVVLDDSKEVKIPNNGILTGGIQVAMINPASSSILSFSLKVGSDAEKASKAMEAEAASAHDIFKSPLKILYTSLDDQVVELKVSCEVEVRLKDDARSRLIRAAYLSKGTSS
ncbi:MAG TPA: mechanosensitive ion channel domain-containing protein [Conexivisphaerales archaeon]|nr:mechanosensitive ion channel domain-containing protein [Conexivisphaerales archaeon]